MKPARMVLLGAVSALMMFLAAGGAAAEGGATPALDRIRKEQIIRIAFREDAPPFSFKNSLGEPAGFMVDLCRAVADKLRQQLNLASLNVVYVPVIAADRFAAIKEERADLLCEPTTATLSRREEVDFSIPTFVDGAGLLVRQDDALDLTKPKALSGKKIGVLAGTTTEAELKKALENAGITAAIVLSRTHAEGIAMLDDDKISAYFADRAILRFLIKDSKAPEKLVLTNRYYTLEPYALALPRGDDGFRLAVDRALSHLYRSGEIGAIFQHAFGENAEPSETLEMLYQLSGLPD
jgi:ABC-type amino acid transport substrate-binding protein